MAGRLRDRPDTTPFAAEGSVGLEPGRTALPAGRVELIGDPVTATEKLYFGYCHVEFAVTSCSDAYQRNLRVDRDCFFACPMCGASCGPCEGGFGVLVAAGSYHDEAWDGFDPVLTRPSDTCACYQTPNAVAGRYRVPVPVWTSDPAGGGMYVNPLMNHATILTQDFILDHAGGIVEIRL